MGTSDKACQCIMTENISTLVSCSFEQQSNWNVQRAQFAIHDRSVKNPRGSISVPLTNLAISKLNNYSSSEGSMVSTNETAYVKPQPVITR